MSQNFPLAIAVAAFQPEDRYWFLP